MKYLKQLVFAMGFLVSSASFCAVFQDPGFDFVNKTNKAVYITLINGGDTLLNKTEIASAVGKDEGKLNEWKELGMAFVKAQFKGLQQGSVKIDISEPTKLFIYKSKTDANPFVHTFTKGKTIYLTYDGKLRPQSGRLAGFSGYSRKGYPLSNNVTAQDIKASKETEEEETKEEGVLKDPAYEPKSKYTREEWIEWYQSGGYTPDQYEKWLVGVKKG